LYKKEKVTGDPSFTKPLSKKEFRKLKPIHQDAYMVWALENVVDFVTTKPEWLKTEKEKGIAREPVFTRELSTKEYRKLKPHQQDAYYRWVCNDHLEARPSLPCLDRYSREQKSPWPHWLPQSW
jgi:hypothetical protein